ncbi:MAG TPA: hypothetical protein VK939_18105 [Longimicrobiales bacterium]|nr:hypothetical protein [Longimicrobiales bacterium]
MNDQNREGGTFERAGEAMGETAGRIAGKATDAAFSATGALFNSMTAMLGSWWSGSEAQRAAGSFADRKDRACREHFESRTGRGASDYERTRPLYQFGHVAGSNPDYQGRSFSEVEPQLRHAWEAGGTNEFGAWDDVSDYVGYGFGQGTGSPGLDRDEAGADPARDATRDRGYDDPLGGGGI